MALRTRTGSAPLASPSFRSSPLEPLNVAMKKLEPFYGQLKVYIAQESTNGEQFAQPLREIKNVLERAVQASCTGKSSTEGGNAPVITEHIKNFIYLLATEKLPQLISYMTRIKVSKQEMGVLLLDVLCYVMALERDSVATFPSTFASCLLYLPSPEWENAYDEVMSRLCHYVLPLCLVNDDESQCSLSTSPALMMVLEGCAQPKLHLLIADTLMQLKRGVCTDILSVIAYGTPTARQNALNLLLHYWPLPLPEFSIHTPSTYGEWSTPNCEHRDCRNSATRATVLCLNPLCAYEHKDSDKGPTKLYMLLCRDCDTSIHGSTTDDTHLRLQFPQPLRDVKPNCEFQKICSGKDSQVNKAEVTCYGSSCTRIQNGQPIRMCRDCHNKQHRGITDPRHIFQVGPPEPWSSDDLPGSSTMLDAVSKLLETTPMLTDLYAVRGGGPRFSTAHMAPGPRYQLEVGTSREGMWLLKHYCTPSERVKPVQQDWLVHLVALVLEWLQGYYECLQRVWEEAQLQGEQQEASAVSIDPDYVRMVSYYGDVSNLIHTYTLPWLRSVCASNVDSLLEVLKPTLRGCAQVGRLWNKAHGPIERYQRTLNILFRLYLLFRDHALPEDAFAKVFNSVMPLWLDLLVDLRNEPGKMERLGEHLRQIFTSYVTHDEGLKTYGFIFERFRGRDPETKQKTLFWLQDLTRLKVPIPYLPHMFEDALRERRGMKKQLESTSSFDEEMGRKESRESGIFPLSRKESSGSLSGYESESALISQSSLDQADTQAVISLNSSIARFILILDIWLVQVLEHRIQNLEYAVLQRTLLKMLSRNWGSAHTFPDHRDTSNMCILCRAMALWFSLATKLIQVYIKKMRESSDEPMDVTDLGSPTLESKRIRISLKLKLSTPIIRRKKGATGEGGVEPHRKGSTGKKLSQESVDFLDSEGPKQPTEGGEEPQTGEQDLEVKSKRKLAKVQSYSEFEVVARPPPSVASMIFTPPPVPPAPRSNTECQDEAIPGLYKIFQHCIEKLSNNLHPDVMQQIILCMMCLVSSGHVLNHSELRTTIITDIKSLFNKLWKCLESETSHVARLCVGLMFECVQFLCREDPTELERSLLWKSLEDGMTSGKWSVKFRTVEKFTLLLQFMLSREVVDVDYQQFDPTLQVTLAHSFCRMVQLLQDKNSNVCIRTQYCIVSLKDSSIEVVRYFMLKLFGDHPVYHPLILQTLSLLNSALPEFHFLTIDFFNKLLACVTNPTKFREELQLQATSVAGKKTSEASVLSGGLGLLPPPRAVTPKASTTSMATTVFGMEEDQEVHAAQVQQIISLLLRYMGNPRSDAKESMKHCPVTKSQQRRRTIRKGQEQLPEEEMVEKLKSLVCQNFQCSPGWLRKRPIFGIFLNNIFMVLDYNIEFGQTRNLIPFVLSLLVFSTASAKGDFPYLNEDSRRDQAIAIRWKGCGYTLGLLPCKLQAPWLRVFFVVLYKYIHHYSEGADHPLLLARWCLEIALNTLEVDPHTCTFLPSRPQLRRQNTVESSSSVPQTPTIELPSPSSSEGAPGSGKLGVALSQQRETAVLTPVPEEFESTGVHKSFPGQKLPEKTPVVSTSTISSTLTSVSDSLKPAQPHVIPLPGVCSICGKVTNEFTEEVIALCVVAVGTCSHRMPSIVSTYLVSRIIPAVSKVIMPGSYTWQNMSASEPPPGSAMAIARHFLASILTQFADRSLFLYLFGHDLGSQANTVFTAMASSFRGSEGGEQGEEEERGLLLYSPVKYFLEDARTSLHFSQDVRRHSLLNLACYMEQISFSAPMLMKEIPLWDSFCKKLRGHAHLLQDEKAVYAFLQAIVILLESCVANPSLYSYHASAIQSFQQSLATLLEAFFHTVYCPLGGLVQLAGLWYSVFQHSQRESEKFVRLYIVELRKALKARPTGESIRSDNFLSLIQVLLLEEDAYLGYVDGLTEQRLYAPGLKRMYELHCNQVIRESLQWDFGDALIFLSTHNHRWPAEVLPQLKLSVAQLIALRVSRQRPPHERLKRIISGDLRPIITTSTKSAGAVVHPRWQDSLVALHMFAWLILGAMCHNAVDSAALESVCGPCRLLYSLNTHMDVVTRGMTDLTKGALQKLKASNEPNSGFLYLSFMFTTIWTMYMELYVPSSASFIVDFWQNITTHLIQLLRDTKADETYRKDVVYSLNDWAIVRLKRAGLSCYSLLLPIWRETTVLLADQSLEFPIVPPSETTLSVEAWFRDAVKEMLMIEGEWQPGEATASSAL